MVAADEEEYPAGLHEWSRDGKRWGPTRESLSTHLILVAVIGLVFPMYTMFVLPVAVVLHGVRMALAKKTVRTRPAEGEDDVEVRKGTLPPEERQYDLVLFGATGFTGRLAAEYIAKTYGGSTGAVKWAVAGRNRDALEGLVRSLGPAVDIIVADATDEASLHAVAADARCVVNTAGPFARYATGVVKVCVGYGTHYVDVSAEWHWIRELVDRFDAKCQKTGSRIISSCGFDSVPWDMTTFALAQYFKEEHQQNLASVYFVDRVVAQPSGGTLETILSILFGQDRYTASLPYDPLDDRHGERSPHRFQNKNVRGIERAPDGAVCKFFVMAEANAKTVRRSNALLGYSGRLRYGEGEAHGGLLETFCILVETVAAGAWLACPPVLSLARKFVLPAPGQGPSKASMKEGFLHVTAFAHGDAGAKTRAVFYLRDEPGYRDTARMLVEGGITLASTPEADLGHKGVVTPAAGMGRAFLERLKATGTGFAFHPWRIEGEAHAH